MATDSGYHYAYHATAAPDYSYLYDLHDIPTDFQGLTLCPTSEQSILTIPTIFAAAVAAATQIPTPSSGLSIQEQVNDALTTATASKHHTNSDAWKTPPEGGWRHCHSHGKLRSKMHTSANCKNCKPGHKKEATLAKKMGGETNIWRDKNHN